MLGKNHEMEFHTNENLENKNPSTKSFTMIV